MKAGSLRIGRTVPHAPGVEVDAVTAWFSPCRTWRYLLTLPYRDRLKGNDAVVILKNPSSADEQEADKTVRTAAEFVWRRFPEVSRLHVLNLFAIRGTDVREVGRMIRSQGAAHAIGPENQRAAGETLAQSRLAVIAWGAPSGIPQAVYDARIAQVSNLLKSTGIPVYRNARKGSSQYPFHACYWGYDDPVVLV